MATEVPYLYHVWMLRVFQCPLLTPVQPAQNSDNRGMVEVELGAAQQLHYHHQAAF